jgi:hypothetical protein
MEGNSVGVMICSGAGPEVTCNVMSGSLKHGLVVAPGGLGVIRCAHAMAGGVRPRYSCDVRPRYGWWRVPRFYGS